MNFRKILTTFLSAALCISLFASCGSGAPAGNSSTPSPQTSPSTSQGTSAEGDSWLPAGDKPVLRQLNINLSKDYNTLPVAADIEKITGYKVQYDMLPAENAMDKLNLIMASGELYDICVIGGDIARVMEYAKQGALADINPYLQYASYLNDAMNDYERDSFTLNGGLFAVGMSQLEFDGHGDVRSALWARQDWMENLGIAIPKTVDDLTNLLRAFKGYDNGTGNPTIPLTLTSTTVAIDGLIGAFGIPLEWNEVDGQLVYRGADPRMKDYLDYMKALYQEGLLDAEYPANKGANVDEKYTNGIAGMSNYGFFSAPSIFTTMAETQPNQKTVYLPPVEGPGGKAIGTYSGGFDRIAFIPAVSKNIAHTVNFMNLKLEPEAFKILTVGYENVHYTVNDKGEYWPVDPIFFDERGDANNYSTGRYVELYPDLWQIRNRKNKLQYECWNAINGPGFIEYIENSEIRKAPAFPETSKNKQSLDQMLLDQSIKIIAGSETTATYDDFLQKWMDAGGAAMTQEYNDWYKEFNSGK